MHTSQPHRRLAGVSPMRPSATGMSPRWLARENAITHSQKCVHAAAGPACRTAGHAQACVPPPLPPGSPDGARRRGVGLQGGHGTRVAREGHRFFSVLLARTKTAETPVFLTKYAISSRKFGLLCAGHKLGGRREAVVDRRVGKVLGQVLKGRLASHQGLQQERKQGGGSQVRGSGRGAVVHRRAPTQPRKDARPASRAWPTELRPCAPDLQAAQDSSATTRAGCTRPCQLSAHQPGACPAGPPARRSRTWRTWPGGRS